MPSQKMSRRLRHHARISAAVRVELYDLKPASRRVFYCAIQPRPTQRGVYFARFVARRASPKILRMCSSEVEATSSAARNGSERKDSRSLVSPGRELSPLVARFRHFSPHALHHARQLWPLRALCGSVKITAPTLRLDHRSRPTGRTSHAPTRRRPGGLRRE